MDFNISELAEEAEVSRPTANRVVKKFVEWGIMEVSQRRGGNDYYQINPDSPFVIAIENFNNTIIEHILGEETLHEIHDYWKDRTPQMKTEITVVEAKPEIKNISTEHPWIDIWKKTEPLTASTTLEIGGETNAIAG